jgi:hypothetical protein
MTEYQGPALDGPLKGKMLKGDARYLVTTAPDPQTMGHQVVLYERSLSPSGWRHRPDRCAWCNCDPDKPMPNGISPHATYCPHYRTTNIDWKVQLSHTMGGEWEVRTGAGIELTRKT